MAAYINQSEIKYQENKKKRENQIGISSDQYFNKSEYQYRLNQVSSLLEKNPTIVEDIDARMNQFAAEYDSFFKGYKSAETAKEESSKLKTQADELNKLFTDYGIIFEDDYISDVTDFINNSYRDIDKGVDYYSKFASEDEYNSNQRMLGYENKYSGMSQEDESKALTDLKNRYAVARAAGNKDAALLKEELDFLYNYGNEESQIVGRKQKYRQNNTDIANLSNQIKEKKENLPGTYIGGLYDEVKAPSSRPLSAEEKEINELIAQRNALIAENNRYDGAQKQIDVLYDEIKTIQQRDDYTKLSQAEESKIKGIFGDNTYDYINDIDGYRGKYSAQKMASGGGGGLLGIYRFMTNDEIGIYNYYYAKEGKDSAETFLEKLQGVLEQRQRASSQEAIEGAISKGGLEGAVTSTVLNIASIPAKIIGGPLAFLDNSIRQISGQEINPDSSWQNLRNFANDVRGITTEQIEQNTSLEFLGQNVMAQVYNALMSAEDSVVGGLTMGPLYTIAMGSGAAADKSAELYEKGASNSQIFWGGLSAGIAETVFEKVSLENLIKPKNPDSFFKIVLEIFKQAGIEGSEEIATEIANTITDSIIMGSQSDLSLAVKAYQEDGLSYEEAYKKALLDKVVDISWAGIAGFMSGGISSIAMTGYQGAKNAYIGRDIKNQGDTEAMILAGMDASQDSQAYELAQRASRDYIEGDALYRLAEKMTGADSAITKTLANKHGKGNVSSMRLGALKQTTLDDVVSQYRDTKNLSKSDIQTQLESKGMNADQASKFAAIVSKIAKGDVLSEREAEAVKDNSIVQDVANNIQKKDMENYISAAGKYSKIDALGRERKTESPDTFKVSDVEGKTLIKDSGEEIKIVDIASIKDGKMMLQVDNGTEMKEIEAVNVSYASAQDAILYESVADMGINAASANALIGNFDATNGQSAKQYMLGVQEAYRYGMYNFPKAEMTQNGFSAELTQAQKDFAYNLGRIDGANGVKGKEASLAKSVKKNGVKTTDKKGRVEYNGDEKNLTERQRVSLKALKAVSESLGVNIHLYESVLDENGKRVYTDSDGKKITANGWYDTRTGDIYIDINSGLNGEGVMLFTAAHELTHFIRQWSPAKFKVLADFLMGEYGKGGASVSGLVHAQMAKAKKQGRTLSYDAAYEEMIADSMTTMLSDGKVVEKLAKLAKKDKSLAEKIKEFIDKLVQDIKKAYVGIKPDTKEGQFVQEMIGSAEKLQELFYDALVHAGENYKDANVKENSEKSLIPDGIKLSERDSDGNILTNAQQEYFKHSKIRDAEGNLLVVRHGTDAEFNIFDFSKSGKNGKAEGYGFYFSDDKKITSKYGGIQKELYLNITKPLYNNKRTITKTELVKLTNALIDFDIETYKSEELTWQDSFISNYVMTYDMSRQSAVREFVNQIWDYNTNDQDIVFEIAQSDGRMYNNSLMRDFYNVLTESIGYDGIIAEWNHGDGNSNVYVAFESNQSKNTTNTNPTSDPDIRYDERDYSYESLISKPDMKITQIEENVPKNRADVIFEAKKNATQIGKRHKDGSVYVHVNDIDTDVILGTRGLQHGLDRRFKTLAPVTIKAGEILKNSIRINEMIPKTNSAFESYILVGAAKNKNGELYIVQSVINKYNLELTSMDVLYAINAKTEPELGKKKNRLGADPRGGQHKGSGLSDSMNTATLNAPRSTENPLSVTNSIISISELLDLVNKYFPDVLPESVLRHYNYTERPEGELGESALYSERHEESLSNRTLLANALENAVQNDIEKKRLSEYKEKIEIMEGEEKKLSTVRKEIKELSFAPGKRDKAKIRSLQDEATTLANRLNTYDRQLLRLEASAALKNVLEREKAAVRKKQKQQDSEILRAYKQQAAAKQEAIISRYQASREKAIDSRHKTVVRSKIKGIVNDLNKLLLNPTKDKHVPIELQKPVAEALDILNMDTLGADKRVAYYNNLIAKESDPDIVADLKKTRDHIQGQGENLMRKIDALKSAYSEIKNSEDPLIADAHDEVIESTIQSVIKEIGDTSIRDMSLSQLESVYDMFKMVLTKVRDANKEFAGEQKRTIEEMGQAVSSEIRRIGGEKERQLSAMNWLKKQGWDMLKPIYAFRMIGSDTLTYLYNKVRNGEDTWYTDVSQAKDFLGEQRRKYGFYAWDFDSRATFTAKSGEKFSLSLEQIMSIYAYSKREQAMKHLLEGGIVFDNSIKVVEKNKVGMPLKYDVSTAKAYSLSQEMLDSIIYTLTAEQKAFVDSMQEYLSTVMGEKGNEISLKMYGIKLFKERFYFPLKSSNYYMNFKPEEVGETRIKNSGFTKETVKKANNPVVLSDFSSVWANHVNDMSMYHAFVLPIEDFNRVFNYRTAVAGNAETTSVKAALANAYGTGAETYIRNLLTDINGGARTQGTDIVDKFMGLAKKNAVFASLSVGIQQLSAIPRAFSYINPKYFGHAIIRSLNLVRHKSDWGEIKRYAPVAGIKEMGYFDTGVGRNTVDWLNEHEYDGVKEKVFAFLKDSEYRKKATDDVLSALPAFVDEIGWVQIWHAVKKEIAATTNLAIESEEFLQKCGERFTEVVTLTQVYDSTLSRSGMMRNKDRLMKMATAFMAEPTVQLNMLVDAGIQGKRKGGLTGFKTVAGTTGAVMASMVINSLLKAIVMAGRDDDEDKTYAEKYVKSLVDDIKSNLNPLTLVPFFKDVVSVFSGYDVNRMDMTLFSDLKKALDAFDNEKKSTVDKITGLSSALSGFFGIPAKNVERDIRAIYNTILSFTNGQNTTKQGLETAIKEGWTGETESDSQQLYNAIMDGDEEHIERIKSRFKDQDAINAAMRKTLRENDHRIREAAQAKIEIRNSEYESIVYEIKEEENFSLDIIIGAINNEITALKKETEEQNTEAEQENETDEMEKLSSIYSASDINRAFDKGKTAAAIEIIEDILKVETENYIRKGYKKKEAEQKAASSLRSSMTSYWKPLFLEAYKKGDKQEQERIRRILKESKLYGRANDVVKTTQQWIKDMRKKGQ